MGFLKDYVATSQSTTTQIINPLIQNPNLGTMLTNPFESWLG